MKVIYLLIFVASFVLNDLHSQPKNFKYEDFSSQVIKNVSIPLDYNWYHEVDANLIDSLKVKYGTWNYEEVVQLLNWLKSKKIDYRYYLLISKVVCSSIVSEGESKAFNLSEKFNLDFIFQAIDSGHFKSTQEKTLLMAKTVNKFSPSIRTSPQYYARNERELTGQISILKTYASKCISYFNTQRGNNKLKAELHFGLACLMIAENMNIDTSSNSKPYIISQITRAIENDSTNQRYFLERAFLRRKYFNDLTGSNLDYLKCYELRKKMAPSELVYSYYVLAEISINYSEMYDHKNSVKYSLLGIAEINSIKKDPKRYSSFLDEEYRIYLGKLNYYSAIGYFNLQQKNKSCEYLREAVNFGYDLESLDTLMNYCNERVK